MSTVKFPNLNLEFHINKIAFTLGQIEVHWYALIILLGVILGFLYGTHFAKRERLDTDCCYDVLLWGLPSAIIMARLYYVVFNYSLFKDDFWSIFQIWNGGIAIYGAVIGAAISTYIYAKVKKIPILQLFDIGSFGLIVGQAIGRWGNFVNEEAYGSATKSLFAMSSKSIRADLLRQGQLTNTTFFLSHYGAHPTFLYESVWNLLGAILLGVFHKYKKHHGQIFFLYLTWYGIGRFFIEGLRMDSLYLGQFRISQIVAAVTAVVGIVMLVYYFRKPATFSLQTVCKDAQKQVRSANEKSTGEENNNENE